MAVRWTRIVEIVTVLVLIAVAVGVTLLTATGVRGQTRPPVPAAPGAPRTPTAPTAPAAPPDSAAGVGPVQDVSLALLLINTRGRRADAIVGGLGQTLVSVSGHRVARPDAERLASVLAETLTGRELAAGSRDRLAAGLAAALATGANGDELERALGQVQAALAGAGLGHPDLLLVDREVRRLVRGRR